MAAVSRPTTLASIALIAMLAIGWWHERSARQAIEQQLDGRVRQLAAETVVASPAPLRSRSEAFASPAMPGATGPQWASRPSAQDQKAQKERALSDLEQRFAGDGTDPTWASSAEDAVAAAVSEPALKHFAYPTRSDVRCARSMCRFVFSFASLDQAEDWSTYFPLTLVQTVPVFRAIPIVAPDGHVELRMFAFRDQHPSGL